MSDDSQNDIERIAPLIEPGAPLPGQWVDKPGGSRFWEGEMAWRTRHGPATLFWSLGEPDSVTDALLPTGERGQITRTLDFGLRREGSGDRLWIYGEIDIRDDDVVFIDGAQPASSPPEPPRDGPDLEADLAQDTAFLAALADERFAKTVYALFLNRAFYKGADERPWLCGDRQAARLVARLRGRGESYQDFYLRHDTPSRWPEERDVQIAWLEAAIERDSHPIGDALRRHSPYLARQDDTTARRPTTAETEQSKAVRLERLHQSRTALAALKRDEGQELVHELSEHLARLGWRVSTQADKETAERRALAARVAILRELRKIETRPSAPPAEWTTRRQGNLRRQTVWTVGSTVAHLTEEERAANDPGSLRNLIVALALDGKLTEPEFDAYLQRIASTIAF